MAPKYKGPFEASFARFLPVLAISTRQNLGSDSAAFS
jgi:hypothetical protein